VKKGGRERNQSTRKGKCRWKTKSKLKEKRRGKGERGKKGLTVSTKNVI